MKNNFDDLLREALVPTDEPKETLNRCILQQAKKMQEPDAAAGRFGTKARKGGQIGAGMKKKKTVRKKFPAAAMIAVGVLALGSVTAVAAYRYLSPGQIAAQVKDQKLGEAFAGEDALLMHETQESNGYRITLLGSVAGKNISQYLEVDDQELSEDDRIYTIVAIEHADGTPMPDSSSAEYGEESFYVSHYIRGLDPAKYSLMRMGGSYSEIVKDGVQYRLLVMDNLEMFADRGIYVGVSSGVFYDTEAYRYDEGTGEMSPNEAYDGVNALFVLPLDPKRADPEAAAAYLEELEKEEDAPQQPQEMDGTDLLVEEFIAKLTPENIDTYAVPLEATRQICKADANGDYPYAWKLEDGSGADGVIFMDDSGVSIGERRICGYTYSENGLEDLKIETYMLREDNTVEYVVYVPIRNSSAFG